MLEYERLALPEEQYGMTIEVVREAIRRLYNISRKNHSFPNLMISVSPSPIRV